MQIIQALRQRPPEAIVLVSDHRSLSNRELLTRVQSLSNALRERDTKCVALCADNGIDWIVADLACLEAGIRTVPVPLFFSPQQVAHVLETSGADVLLADRPLSAERGGAVSLTVLPGLDYLKGQILTPRGGAGIPPGTWKITYSSGTTGAPKGVCLAAPQLMNVARSLHEATGLREPRHLCVLPLSTLLENVGGVYAPILAGGTICVPSLSSIGLSGSSDLDPERLLASVRHHRPGSLILVPEILRALTAALELGESPLSSLQFVAVGGSKTAPALIERSWRAGLPVYEGYGLSECASVVALNTPATQQRGSAGLPLRHVGIRVDRGEICVSGSPMLGYVGDVDSWFPSEIKTGDLGHLDAEGFLHIDGRIKNLVITGFGRNLSPEWVESELLAGPTLTQAVVLGDAQPYCAALVHPGSEAVTDEEIATCLREVNERLPDYARICDWRRLPEPLDPASGLLTPNGRPRRDAIAARYSSIINDIYGMQPEAVNQ